MNGRSFRPAVDLNGLMMIADDDDDDERCAGSENGEKAAAIAGASERLWGRKVKRHNHIVHIKFTQTDYPDVISIAKSCRTVRTFKRTVRVLFCSADELL